MENSISIFSFKCASHLFFCDMQEHRQAHLSSSESTEILHGPETPHPRHVSELDDLVF